MDREALEYIIRIAGAEEVQRALKVVTGEAQNVNEQTKKQPGILDGGLAAVGKLMAAWQALSRIVGLVREIMSRVRQESERSADSMNRLQDATARLLQLGGGDKKRMDELMTGVRETRLQTGASPAEASRLQFQLASLGLEDQREYFAKWMGITDAPTLAESVKTIQTAFGEQAAGTVQQIIDKLLAAAGSSKVDLETISPEASMIAQSAGAVGASPEETLSNLSVLTNSLKSARIAATQIRALNESLLRKGITGKGTLGGVEQVQAMGMDEQKLIEFLGSSEAFSAYNAILKNRQAIAGVSGDIGKAVQEGLGEKIIQSQLSDPARRAAIERRRAEQAVAVAEEDRLAQGENVRQTMILKDKAAAIESGRDADKIAYEDYITEKAKEIAPVKGLFKKVTGLLDDMTDTARGRRPQNWFDRMVMFGPESDQATDAVIDFGNAESQAFNPAAARSLRPATRGQPVGGNTYIGVQYAPDQQNPVDAPRPVGPGGQ